MATENSSSIRLGYLIKLSKLNTIDHKTIKHSKAF